MTATQVSDRTLRVLEAFVADPNVEMYGYPLMRQLKIPSGTLYPILSQLESIGWLSSGWDNNPTSGPRRRYYRLTADGVREARHALAAARAGRRQTGVSRAPAWGAG